MVGSKSEVKSFEIDKRLVHEAWMKVQANGGAPGVDAVSIGGFREAERDNLYKLWNRMSSGSYWPGPVRAVEIPKDHGAGRGVGVCVRGRCGRRAGDDAVVVDGSGRVAAADSIVDRGAGRSVGGDTRHPGLLIVMPGHRTLLCDECTQERSVWSVDAGVAGSSSPVGRAARRRGAGADRVADRADPPLRALGLPLRGGRTTRPLCLLRSETGRPGPGQVRAGQPGRGGTGPAGPGRAGGDAAGRDLGDQRRTAGQARTAVDERRYRDRGVDRVRTH